MSVIYVVLILIILLVGVMIYLYNRLVKQRILTREGWSGIGTFLQQRNDLIPNLVETVKGYALHESSTLTDVIKWRNQLQGGTSPAEQMEASNQLNAALGRFFALAEAYPELKANQNFLQLQQDLKEIETSLNQSRRYYNATVRNLNSSVEIFPSNIVASLFGFKAEPFFEENPESREVPKVKFGS
ncbi:MAG: LemA family protein [Flavipsychrobacter sp.]|jgi:LemA protein|nr:LemA family protein [Flavipsychrobacter sp.]